jgi:threonine aldolase
MSRYFKSDNTAPASPSIIAALAAVNEGYATGYGDDTWSGQLDARFSEVFERAVRVFVVPTGTAANALALATLTPACGAILAHEYAHVVRDECGATEFMSGSARLLLLRGVAGKLHPTDIDAAVADNPASVHTVQPAALTLTQASEFGRVYTSAELAALAATAHRHGLKVHMDGARFANALVHLDCTPAEATWKAGIDVLSFGATKNGALAAEAVVFFDLALVRDFELRRKRAGHLLSKMRFVSAQLLAYLDDDLWLRNARHANAGASAIARVAAQWLMFPVEANELFVDLGAARLAALRAAGFEFYDWGPAGSGQARFVVSWNQSGADVAALCDLLASLRG